MKHTKRTRDQLTETKRTGRSDNRVSNESTPKTAIDLVALVKAAYQQAEKAQIHCAYTTDSRQLNGPYNFNHSSSLASGRASHLDPLLIVQKDRADGLKEIRENFVDRVEEHCWIFIPQLKIWIDDTTTVSAGSVGSDLFLRVKLLQTFPEIEVFHTHPDGLYAALHAEGELSSHHRLIAPTPSLGDQFGAAMIEDLGGPNCSLKSHIISYHGVTSYQQTKEFRRDAGMRGGSFQWDFNSVDRTAPACKEISRICSAMEDSVPCIRADGSKTATWLIRFTPFEE